MKAPLRERPGQDVALSADHLVVGKTAARPLLQVEHFHLKFGEAALVIAPTGGGKTLFCETMFGAIRPTSGNVTLLGYDLARTGERRRARQSAALIGRAQDLPNMTATDFLRSGDASLAVNAASDVTDMLAFAGLGAAAALRVRDVSPMQGRLLLLVRAILRRVRVIIADGLFDGLCEDSAQRGRRLLNEAQRLGAAVLVTSARDDVGGLQRLSAYSIKDGQLRTAMIAAAR